MLQRPMVGYEPSSRLFAMGIGTQTVRLWKLGDAEDGAVAELKTDRSAVSGVAVVGDGELVTVHETGVVAGWNGDSLRAGKPETAWELETGLVVSEVAVRRIDPTRRILAVGGEQGRVVVCRIDGTGRPEITRYDEAHGDQIDVLEFSADDGLLATAARDREIAVWSVEVGDETVSLEEFRRLSGSGGWPLTLSFSASGRRLASGCMDNGVYFWDLEADEPLRETRFEHHGWVEDVRWTAGDEALTTASWDNTVGVYRGEDGAPTFQFMYHDDYVAAVLPVPDSTLVFAGSYDGDVTVWDWKAGELEAVLEGHRDWVIGLVWLGDGRVASISSDKTARLWSVDDLAEAGMLGEPAVSDFELGGGLDLASFGIEDDRERLGGDTGRDREVMSPKLVRRFDAEGAATAGGQDPAMSMLEEALETTEGVDAGGVDVDEAVSGETAEFEPSVDEEAGTGDEISSLVRDAISDVEETEIPEPDLGDAEDVESAVDEPGEDRDEPTEEEAMDLLDVPDIETASADDLGDDGERREQPERETGPEEAQRWSGEVPDADLEATAEALGESSGPTTDSEEYPDVDDLAQEAFEDVHGDVDIMDSTFDSAAPDRDETPDEEGAPEGAVGDEDSVPTSGPDYDPQPVESGDEVSDLLPDEDELEDAFSSSVAETVDEDSKAGADSGDDEPTGERDVDRAPDDGDPPGDSEESSGKAEPSSASGESDHGADGGEKTPWERDESQSTSMRGKPLPAMGEEPSSSGDSASTESGDDEPTGPGTMAVENADSGPGAGSRDGKAPERTETASPFTSIDEPGESKSGSVSSEASSAPEESGDVGGEGTSLNRDKLEKLAERLDRESSAPTEEVDVEIPESDKQGAGPEPSDVVEEVARTQLEEGEDEGFDRDIETDNIDAQSVARRDRDGESDESEPTSAAGDPPGTDDETPTGEESTEQGAVDDVGDVCEPSEAEDDDPKGLKGGLADSMQLDESDDPSVELDGADSAISDVDEIGDLDEESGDDQSRLMPGDSIDGDELNIPEPQKTEGSASGSDEAVESAPETTEAGEIDPEPPDQPTGGVADEETSAFSSIRRVPWDEIWERGQDAAPKMGILRRGPGEDADFEPDKRLPLEQGGAVALAVSGEQHHLAVAGEEGLIEIRDADGDPLHRFVSDERRQWVEVGFLEGDRFLYGVDRGGCLSLWLLPEDGDEPVREATAETSGVTYRVAAYDAEHDWLLVGSDEGVGYLWDLVDGECVARLKGHGVAITGIAVGERGPITAGLDGSVRFWNPKGLQIDQVSTSGEIRDLAASDGLLTWIEAGGAIARMEEGTSEVTQLQGHFGEGKAVDATDDGRWITGGDDGRMLVRGLRDDEIRQEIQVPSPVYRLEVRSEKLVAASPGGVVYLFERTRG